MTPAARLSAAIDVLDQIAAGKGPADQVLKAWGKAHRFAGSADRRAIAERVYQCLRARARLAWAMGGADGRALVLGAVAHLDRAAPEELEALFSGLGHGPAALTAQERARLAAPLGEPPPEVAAGAPGFVAEALQRRFGADWLAEAQALIQPRAPVDLRVNALRGPVDKAASLLAHEGIEAAPAPFSAWGLRLPPDLAPDIQKTRAYADGWIEVQDEGSQLAAFLAGAGPGMTVVDYCAGGGGKTLALAMEMGLSDAVRPPHPPTPLRGAGPSLSPPGRGDNDTPLPGGERSSAAEPHRTRGRSGGRLIACDVNPRRLDAIPERLARARAKAELRRMGTEGQGTEDLVDTADLVFVDGPCSGSGTWRRHPEGAWRTSAEDVARLSALQTAILTRAAELVRPGGRLAYVTCSVLPEENDAVAARFAAARPDFRPRPIREAAATPRLTDAARTRLADLAGPGHTVQLTPHRTGTDGFFIALFERPLAE